MSMVEGDAMPNVDACENNMVDGRGTLYCTLGAEKERIREPLGMAMGSGAFLRLNGFTAEAPRGGTALVVLVVVLVVPGVLVVEAGGWP